MEVALTSDQAVITHDKIEYADNSSTVDVDSRSTLHRFIQEEVETIEALESIKDKLKTQDELEAYANKLEELQSKSN